MDNRELARLIISSLGNPPSNSAWANLYPHARRKLFARYSEDMENEVELILDKNPVDYRR